MTNFWRRTKTNRKISESDYIRITSLAYKELISQRVEGFLIKPDKFQFPEKDIIITSVQDYARLTGIDYHLLIPQDCQDGYVYRNSQPGLDLIFYNESMQNLRTRFTVGHELGHVRLGHRKHDEQEETEAHLYASQLLSPDIIINEIKSMGSLIIPETIKSFCGISISAAIHKFQDFQICQKYKTPYDEELLENFYPYLLKAFKHYVKKEISIYKL